MFAIVPMLFSFTLMCYDIPGEFLCLLCYFLVWCAVIYFETCMFVLALYLLLGMCLSMLPSCLHSLLLLRCHLRNLIPWRFFAWLVNFICYPHCSLGVNDALAVEITCLIKCGLCSAVHNCFSMIFWYMLLVVLTVLIFFQSL